MEILEVMELPAEIKDLAGKISTNKQEEVKRVLSQIFIGTSDWEMQVDAIEVKGIDDKMSIALADAARKNAKNARVDAEKIFDAKRADVQFKKIEFDIEDKIWLKGKQIMQLRFKCIEEKAEWKANYVKRFEAEQKELRAQKRINEVSKFSEINRFEFENMSEESFSSFLLGLKNTHDAKIEAARIAEENRLAKEKADTEAREQQRLENIALKEAAEKRAKEYEAEKAKADAEKKEIEAKAQAERDEAAAEARKLQAENDAKLKAERDARAKLEVDLKAKADAELKAEQDKAAALETELGMGDKDKFDALIKDLETIQTKYTFKSKKYKAIQLVVNELLNKTINHVISK